MTDYSWHPGRPTEPGDYRIEFKTYEKLRDDIENFVGVMTLVADRHGVLHRDSPYGETWEDWLEVVRHARLPPADFHDGDRSPVGVERTLDRPGP